MKNLVKILVFALAVCMMLSLCACGAGNGDAEGTTDTTADTTAEITLPEAEETEPEPAAEAVFTVKLVDSEGNPVAGIPVQVCDDGMCNNATSDAEGNAVFTTDHFDAVEDGYTCSVVVCPGYECEYVGDNKIYLEAGQTELEIVLTKAN